MNMMVKTRWADDIERQLKQLNERQDKCEMKLGEMDAAFHSLQGEFIKAENIIHRELGDIKKHINGSDNLRNVLFIALVIIIIIILFEFS